MATIFDTPNEEKQVVLLSILWSAAHRYLIERWRFSMLSKEMAG